MSISNKHAELAKKIAGALYPSTVDVSDIPIGSYVRNIRDDHGWGSSVDAIGIITHVVPATQKVYVSWPMQKNRQHDPADLVLLDKDNNGLKFMGKVDPGYSSFEKSESEIKFGFVDEDGKVHPPRGKSNKVAAIALDIAKKSVGI